MKNVTKNFTAVGTLEDSPKESLVEIVREVVHLCYKENRLEDCSKDVVDVFKMMAYVSTINNLTGFVNDVFIQQNDNVLDSTKMLEWYVEHLTEKALTASEMVDPEIMDFIREKNLFDISIVED